jgi:hypothetical protein
MQHSDSRDSPYKNPHAVHQAPFIALPHLIALALLDLIYRSVFGRFSIGRQQIMLVTKA